MQTLSRLSAILVLLGCVAAPAMADSPSCGCQLQTAMQKLPSLVFAVGGETTGCDQHAASLAEKSDAPLKFVVQQLFDNKAEAQQALVAKTEHMLAAFTTASTCKASGTTTIAGQKMSCPTSAAKLADAVKSATDMVEVSFKVGDEQCNCPTMAKQLAEKSGKEITFVVNNEETCCPTTSKLNVVRAKYEAALQTVSKSADCDKCTKGDSDCQGCPVTAGMNNLPRLAFVVSGEATTCDKHAATLAEKKDAKIQFAVQQSFENKEQAMLMLVSMTEAMVDEFATPATCQKSGTTTIAGKEMHCSATASKIALDLKQAMDSVKVSYKVGDKTCHCPNEAQAVAKASGEETLFVVNGEKTSCELTNRLNVARAKYRAALQTLANQAAADDADSAESQS